jgi:hypothetical protein
MWKENDRRSKAQGSGEGWLDNKAHLAILKRVGAVLVVIGLIDIVWMIYCIVHKISYRSSLNLFGVIAGALLMQRQCGGSVSFFFLPVSQCL